MTPQYILRSAVPGQPSILWIGKSGRKYRTLVAAKIDKPENAFENATEVAAVQIKQDNTIIIVLLAVAAFVVMFKVL